MSAADPDWTIVDAEARAKKYPATFKLPPRQKREQLEEGDFAKLIFTTPELVKSGQGERMWVRVDGKSDDGLYLGTLDNDAVLIPGLQAGATMAFGPENVTDWMRGEAGFTLPKTRENDPVDIRPRKSEGSGAALLLALAFFGFNRDGKKGRNGRRRFSRSAGRR